MQTFIRRVAGASLIIISAGFLSGCAAPGPTEEQDPFEGFNRAMYSFNDTVDKAILKPIAQGYGSVVDIRMADDSCRSTGSRPPVVA